MHRLVPSPIFVLTAPRSGSTLLRSVLDSHSRVHAPHELHLNLLSVREREWVANGFSDRYASISLDALGLSIRELEHLLWDRLLHHELLRSGKDLIVNKTTSSVQSWRRIAECWPDARYVFLFRNPLHIADSLARAWPDRPDIDPARRAAEFVAVMNEARAELPGHEVRYEELTTRPAETVRRLCDFLGVAWEPAMLDYGRFDHGEYVRGIGDWSEIIRSGVIQPGRPVPSGTAMAEALEPACRSWGYLPDPVGTQ
ncbi:sulfotransferase [Amycolatopsis sp. GM8]|uniref:sulfotransferase family protein n=1 Tax=Amycolatopsis sp. GM8 TaxID=2896530 RepID=UPI001F36A465|nr:sulfotransferase [Amycolatopsis sp. GM8]